MKWQLDCGFFANSSFHSRIRGTTSLSVWSQQHCSSRRIRSSGSVASAL